MGSAAVTADDCDPGVPLRSRKDVLQYALSLALASLTKVLAVTRPYYMTWTESTLTSCVLSLQHSEYSPSSPANAIEDVHRYL